MKLKFQLLALAILASTTLVFAQVNPAGSPVPKFDPATGDPVPTSVPKVEWKDPTWSDPDIILTNVLYPGIPISEVALNLRAQFKESFDVLLPAASDDLNSTLVTMRLKNVKASDVFEAMNLLFENDNKPIRWELKALGSREEGRPVALLRVLTPPPMNVGWSAGAGFGFPVASPEPMRKIFFVGDLVGDKAGMSMKQIVTTIKEVWEMTDNEGGKIQFHEPAQLVVVTGTPGQIDFVEQTLAGLRQKVQLAHDRLSKAADTMPKPAESKLGDAGGSK